MTEFKNVNVHILDLEGRLCKKTIVSDNKTGIHVSDLNNGTYFIVVAPGANQIVRKFIKSNSF